MDISPKRHHLLIIKYLELIYHDNSLPQASVVDVMILRSAVNYDPSTESWSLSTRSCMQEGSSLAKGDRISADIIKNSSPESQHMFHTYSKFIRVLMSTMHGDLLVLKLLIVISLFSGKTQSYW